MHKIYFEKRAIVICPPTDDALTDPNAICFYLGENFNISTLVGMFETNSSLLKIYIPSEDTEATYRRLCSEFYEVNAAGGLVSNRRGDFLLINRYNLWDLPKGHQEPGEDISVCALREVEEETGIHDLQLRDLICVTDHIYYRCEKWHLKHTYWYDMLYTNPTDLTPQREEDINKAAWVAKSSLPPYITSTYPSIAEVFKKFL